MKTIHKFYWASGKTFCGKGKAVNPPAMNYWGEVNCKDCLALKGSLVEVSDTNDQKIQEIYEEEARKGLIGLMPRIMKRAKPILIHEGERRFAEKLLKSLAKPKSRTPTMDIALIDTTKILLRKFWSSPPKEVKKKGAKEE